MIRHMPEGVLPYSDCGYARKPLFPRLGETVCIDCKTDSSNIPVMEWTEDGAWREGIVGVAREAGRYSFCLGPFDRCVRVQYRFIVDNECTRWYSFDVFEEQRVPAPSTLHPTRDGILAVYPGYDLYLEVTFRPQITIRLRTDYTPREEGQYDESRVSFHDRDREISVTSEPFYLSVHNNGQTVLGTDGSLLVLLDARGRVRWVKIRYDMPCGHVYGLGERFDCIDAKGKARELRVVEKFTHQGEYTYFPVPFFFTERGVGVFRETGRSMRVDFRGGAEISMAVSGDILFQDAVFVGEPADMIRSLLRHTGEPAVPPEWAFGVWISGNGWNSDAEVYAQLAALKKYDYPARVLVLEAWSDERTFYRWNDRSHFADPRALARDIADAGLNLVLWQIPVIKCEREGEPGEFLVRDEAEAIAKGYVVKNADGTPYRITDHWFAGSLLLDFTNPAARKWWFSKRDALIREYGVKGFKTDGGEFLYDGEAVLFSGETGETAHNLYPVQYGRAYQDFLRSHGVEGVLFSRAGYTGAQAVPIHWAGDQLSEFSELRAQLTAGLSAGLSGIIFWSFDIGGFAGPLPEKELYLRATALGCFCPIMQWHSEPRGGQFYRTLPDGANNDRSPWNLALVHGDDEILSVACRFARIRERMIPYLKDEADFCAVHARPMMAHLILDFPRDLRVYAIDDEYMLGRGLLVAPIVDAGRMGRHVYLPEGEWRDVFTGVQYCGGDYELECPTDRALVFERIKGEG